MTNNKFQTVLDNLTKEQIDELNNMKATDWIKAIIDCLNDPAFWQDIKNAFIEGVLEGIQAAFDDKNQDL